MLRSTRGHKAHGSAEGSASGQGPRSEPFANTDAISSVRRNIATLLRWLCQPQLSMTLYLTYRAGSHQVSGLFLDVSQTPTKVTPSPANITIVSGSPNSAHAQIIVTGGLR